MLKNCYEEKLLIIGVWANTPEVIKNKKWNYSTAGISCKKMLCYMRKSTNIFRDDREASIIGKKVAWFEKVIGYMMIVAFKMNSCSYECCVWILLWWWMWVFNRGSKSFKHVSIIRVGITCKKMYCYMGNLACR